MPIPSFLLPLTKNIKSHVSKMAGEKDGDKVEDEEIEESEK